MLLSFQNSARFRLTILTIFLAVASIGTGAPIDPIRGFHIFAPGEALPIGKFIFVSQNIRTKRMLFGYSTETPLDPMRRVNTLLPGHTNLVAYDMGVSPEEFLSHHIPPPGEGEYVGGGFYNRGDYFIVHPYFSLKAAGQLEPSVDASEPFTVNGTLPILNEYFLPLLAEPYWYDFLAGIAKVYQTPLAVDLSRLNESAYFNWNTQKNGPPVADVVLSVHLATENFHRVVAQVNKMVLGVRTFHTVPFVKRATNTCHLFIVGLKWAWKAKTQGLNNPEPNAFD